jgi:hypothetical protein
MAPGGPLRNKKLVTAIASVLTLVALSGCSLNPEVESLRPYAPSDGVQSEVGDLKTRNLMFIRNDAGKAILIGSFVNASQNELMASIETNDKDGNTIKFDFSVEPGGVYDLGYNGNPGIILEVDEIAGAMRNVYLAAGGDPIGKPVPVLDGTLEEYRPFAEALD